MKTCTSSWTTRAPRLLAALFAALTLAHCEQKKTDLLQGYIGGECVYIASSQAGLLEKLGVQRGAQVQAGAPLFELESGLQKAAHEEAQRRLSQARASLEDLKKGRRPTELAALEAQQQQAQTALNLSEIDFKRQSDLSKSHATAQENVDRARSAQDQDRARVAQIQADLATARLGARGDLVLAAQAAVEMAEAGVQQTAWHLNQSRQNATQAGQVQDTLYRQGEWVPAGRPVVSLLPPQNIKVRFFVPQPRLASLRPGQPIQVQIDGLATPLAATLSFISPLAEYTPPVIYSAQNRAKLVFMVEATFDPAVAATLHPGQPVDIKLP